MPVLAPGGVSASTSQLNGPSAISGKVPATSLARFRSTTPMGMVQ